MIFRRETMVKTVLIAGVILVALMVVIRLSGLRVEQRLTVAGPDAPAYYAIVRGDPLAEVQRLLDQDPSIINDFYMFGCTLLAYAVDVGRPDVVTLLLARGADPNGKGGVPGEFTPLMTAVMEPRLNLPCIQLLLKSVADPYLLCSPLGASPMEYAQENGLATVVQLFEQFTEDQGPGVASNDPRVTPAHAGGDAGP